MIALGDLLLKKKCTPAFSPNSLICGLSNGGNTSVGIKHQESVFSMSYRINICKCNIGDRIIWEKLRCGWGGVQVQHPTACFLAFSVGILYFIQYGLFLSGPNKAGLGSNLVYSVPNRQIYHALLHYLLSEGKSGKESKSKQSVYHLFWYQWSCTVHYRTANL